MSISITIVSGPIEPAPGVPFDGCGAIVSFEGRVRGTEQTQQIAALVYEVYEPMTARSLHALAAQTVERFAIEHIEVAHSEGRVAVGECSFTLRIGARHRKAAIEATDFFIDEMKRSVPIWKTAVTADGRVVL